MQSGQQVLRLDQKRMEDVQLIREAIVRGVSVLTESEVDFIKQHTVTLGEDGEAAKSKTQEKARESGS
jgi:hypothetical protein